MHHYKTNVREKKIPGHRKAQQSLERIFKGDKSLGEKMFWRAYKFTFVRNPWDRMVSIYYHFHMEEGKFAETIEREMDDGARESYDPKEHPTKFMQPLFITPQADWLLVDGENVMDFVGRFEDYENGFRHVCDTVGIPFDLPKKNINQERKQRDYRQFYTDEAARLVGEWFKADVDAFGYTFDNGMPGRGDSVNYSPSSAANSPALSSKE